MQTESAAESHDSSNHTIYVAPSWSTGRRADTEQVHFLVVETGNEIGHRILVGERPIRLGREPPADIVLRDAGVSRSHCRIESRYDRVVVTDLGSTNGTFIEGKQVVGTMTLPIGGTLQIGAHVLRHVFAARRDFDNARQLDEELEEARAYAHALLPQPWREGPVRTEWLVLPCARLGGDALGHHALGGGRVALYLVDVSGHGARAAMHGASVINALRHHALPGVDFTRPEQVLGGLNAMFGMESHGGVYFTIWYGVYDPQARTLAYAAGGHHPAFLVTPSRTQAIPLHTRNIPVGAMPDYSFTGASIEVLQGSCLYLFSDGVFELTLPDGREGSLADFVPLLLGEQAAATGETDRLYRAAVALGGRASFDDDFSLLVANFY